MPEILSTLDEEARGSKHDSQREIAELLALAESLQENADLWERREVQLTTYFLVGLPLSSAPIFWWGVTSWSKFPHNPPDNVLIIVLAASLGLLGFGALFGYQSGKIRARRQREQYALEEVISLLREIEQAYGKDNDWSALERARFRIRLSRFTVGRSRPVSRLKY